MKRVHGGDPLTADAAPSVTMLTNEYPPHVYGGAGIHVQYLSAALSALTAVEVRCFGPREPAGSVPARSFFPDEAMLSVAGLGMARVLTPLATDIMMAGPPVETSVVHCHTWYTMFAGFLAHMLYGRPLLATVHSLEPLRPWKEEQLGQGYQLSTWLERTGLAAADLVIAVSGGMRADILRVYPIAPERVRVVHNGVDAAGFRRVQTRNSLERRGISEPYILFVGRISRQKGLDVLLRAIPALPDGVRAVICAGAPDTPELAEEMREQARQTPGVVWIEEMVGRDELLELYSHAAVFACPSIYEPFGLINLEAMACGRPVVASRVGGIPEVVVDGETGLLVPPGDPAALAGALQKILADPDLAEKFGANGRRRVAEHFTWEAVALKTLEVYREAIAIHREETAKAEISKPTAG